MLSLHLPYYCHVFTFTPHRDHTLKASCHCAPISIVIASIAPWPSILYPSHRVQDPLRADLHPLRPPLRSIVLLDGILPNIVYIDLLSLCLTSSRCNNLRQPIHISIFSHPQLLVTSQHRHMTAYFKLRKWSTRATPKTSGYLIFRPWWATPSCSVGRSISRSATSTSPLTPIRASSPYMMERLIFQIIRYWTSSTGSTLLGKPINTSTLSLPVLNKHYASHLTQILRTSLSRSKYALHLADIPSSLPRQDEQIIADTFKQRSSTRFGKKDTLWLKIASSVHFGTLIPLHIDLFLHHSCTIVTLGYMFS